MASKRSAWQRNGWPRLIAGATALLAAAGVYGLVQANPKPGSSTPPATPNTTSVDAPQATIAPTVGATAPVAPSSAPSFTAPQAPVQPQQRPHMRTRAS